MKIFGKSFFKKPLITDAVSMWIEDGNPRCAQCNCLLPDDDKSIIQYATSNKRVCYKHYKEINKWGEQGWTYKEWDEIGAKKYPKIYTENNFYKKIGKY